MNVQRKFLLTFLSVGIIFPAIAQVTISGQACVTSGTTYMYAIQGISNTDSVSICISGGIIADAGVNCMNGTGTSYVNVRWSSGSLNGSIAVNSSSGNASFAVSGIDSIGAGIIDSSTKTQTMDTLTVPSTILCSSAIGGSCNPSYTYQWQQSEGDMIWVDIDGATNQNLSMSAPVKKETFYRRRVTDVVSNTIGFSEEAAVFIKYY